MAENKNTKEFTSSQGNKYTFQKVMPSEWIDVMDEVENNKESQRRTLYTKTLENIVVQPKVTLDDFEDYGELEEVVQAANRFQRGK